MIRCPTIRPSVTCRLALFIAIGALAAVATPAPAWACDELEGPATECDARDGDRLADWGDLGLSGRDEFLERMRDITARFQRAHGPSKAGGSDLLWVMRFFGYDVVIGDTTIAVVTSDGKGFLLVGDDPRADDGGVQDGVDTGGGTTGAAADQVAPRRFRSREYSHQGRAGSPLA